MSVLHAREMGVKPQLLQTSPRDAPHAKSRFFFSLSCRAAPGVQTLRPVPLRQGAEAFAITGALGPRRSLLVVNRVDVETRPRYDAFLRRR